MNRFLINKCGGFMVKVMKFRAVPTTKLLYIAMGLSFFIAIFFNESSVAQNQLLSWLTHFVSQFVPGIERVRAVVPYPNLTAAIYAVNWIFFPVNFVLFFWASEFWKVGFWDRCKESAASLGKFKGTFSILILLPLFMLVGLILPDFNLFPGLGFYSMNAFMNPSSLTVQIKLVHAHPMGIAVFYNAIAWSSAASYIFFIAWVVSPILHYLRKWHIIRSEQPA